MTPGGLSRADGPLTRPDQPPPRFRPSGVGRSSPGYPPIDVDVTIFERNFDSTGNPAACVRRDLAAAIRSTGDVDRAWLADVLLVVTELVTNVCLHAGTTGTIEVRRAEGMLEVDVCDEQPTLLPQHRDPSVTSPSGRGLGIVEQLTSICVVEVEPARKRVRVQIPSAVVEHG